MEFEAEDDDNEALRLGLASLSELDEDHATEEKLDLLIESHQSLSDMITDTNNRVNQLKALKSLVYVRSKGHIYIVLRDDNRGGTPSYRRKWGCFFCILCKVRMYDRCHLFTHLATGQHQARFEVARLTLLSPDMFPYNDGWEFFGYDPLNLKEGLYVGNLSCLVPQCQSPTVEPVPVQFCPYRRRIWFHNHNIRGVLDWTVKITAKALIADPQNISSIVCYSEGGSSGELLLRGAQYSLLILTNKHNHDHECFICGNIVQGGLHVSALINMETKTLACLENQLHVFHISCLIHWMMMKEYYFLHPEKRNLYRIVENPVVCPACSPPGNMNVERQTMNQAHEASSGGWPSRTTYLLNRA